MPRILQTRATLTNKTLAQLGHQGPRRILSEEQTETCRALLELPQAGCFRPVFPLLTAALRVRAWPKGLRPARCQGGAFSQPLIGRAGRRPIR